MSELKHKIDQLVHHVRRESELLLLEFNYEIDKKEINTNDLFIYRNLVLNTIINLVKRHYLAIKKSDDLSFISSQCDLCIYEFDTFVKEVKAVILNAGLNRDITSDIADLYHYESNLLTKADNFLTIVFFAVTK